MKKRILSIVVVSSILLMPLVACKNDSSDETYETVSETFETAEEVVETVVDDYQYDPLTIVSDHFSEPALDGGETGCFHIPWINLSSSDASDVNSEITGEAYNSGSSDVSFSVICVDVTKFSLVVDFSYYGWAGYYKAYTFDAVTGHRLTNSEILEYASIDEADFYDQAFVATGNYLNCHPFMEEDVPVISNGEINSEWIDVMNSDTYGMGEGAIDLVSNYISSDSLNTNMGMFLGPDGSVVIWQPIWAMADPHDCEVFYEIPSGDRVSVVFDNGAEIPNNSLTDLNEGGLADGDYRAYAYSFAEDGLSGSFSIAIYDVYTAEEAEEYSSSRALPNGQILDEYNHFELQDNGSYYLLEFDGAFSTYIGDYVLPINPDVVIYDNVDPFYSPWEYYDFTEQIGSIQDFENLRVDENTYDPNPSLFIRISDGEICLIVINPDCHQGWRVYELPDSNGSAETTITIEQAKTAFENYWSEYYPQISGSINDTNTSFTFSPSDSDDGVCVYILRSYIGAQAYEVTYYYMDLVTGSVFTMKYEEIPEGSAAGEPGMWLVESVYDVFNGMDYL